MLHEPLKFEPETNSHVETPRIISPIRLRMIGIGEVIICTRFNIDTKVAHKVIAYPSICAIQLRVYAKSWRGRAFRAQLPHFHYTRTHPLLQARLAMPERKATTGAAIDSHRKCVPVLGSCPSSPTTPLTRALAYAKLYAVRE